MYQKINLSQINARLSNSINSIYSSNQILKSIEHLNPVYAGGFPMALLFAPRTAKGSITSHFTDYDIYFENLDSCNQAIDILMNTEEQSVHFKSENAETIVIHNQASKPTTYQIVTKFNYSPEQVVDTFDFTNCAIAFTPYNSTFTCSSRTLKDHLDGKLNIQNPWMLDKLLNHELTQEQILTYACVQIARFKKYCDRWNYSLSDESWLKLIQVYEKFPNLMPSKNIYLAIDEGPYSGFSMLIKANTNIWSSMSGIISNNKMFSNYDDKHSFFKSGTT